MARLFIYIFLASVAAHAFQTSSESVNPFNQFMSPSGGVNMFSGDAAFTQPITSISGIGGVNASVTLNYSSNVYLNVRARNDVAPTGWLGLGWNLCYGAVICDHKGTKSLVDDSYFMITPSGCRDSIILKIGIFYSKSDPYTKITRVLNAGDSNIIKGWLFTTVDGKKIRYGDFDTAGRSATRYTFAWGDYVGPGYSGTPTAYPYMWDLYEIEDVAGNKVKYAYQQTRENIHVDCPANWTSPLTYTKASYLKKISVPGGASIEFKVTSKLPSEVYDPYTFQSEPDAFMEMYEDFLLDSIKVYNSNGGLTRKFKLNYLKINQSLSGNFVKSLLQSIQELSAQDRQLGVTSFTYNTDFNKGDKDNAASYDSNYNYGGIASVQSPSGGMISYNYMRKNIAASKQVDGATPASTLQGIYRGSLFDGNPYVIAKAGDWFYVYNWNGSIWRQALPSTNLGDTGPKSFAAGNNYFVVTGGSDVGLSRLWVYIWDGRNWVIAKKRIGNVTSDFSNDNLTQTSPKSIYPGQDYFAVTYAVGNGNPYEYVMLFQRNDNEWVSQNLPVSGTPDMGDTTVGTTLGATGSNKIVYPGPNYCIITFNLSNDTYIDLFNRSENSDSKKMWPMSKIRLFDTNNVDTGLGWFSSDLNSQGAKQVIPGPGYFAVIYTVGGGLPGEYIRLYQWDATAWESQNIPKGEDGGWAGYSIYTRAGTRFGSPYTKVAYLQQNYCLFTSQGPNTYMYVLNRDGAGWKMSKRKINDAEISQYEPFATTLDIGWTSKAIYPGEDYFIFTHVWEGNNTRSHMQMYKWNGGSWEFQPLPRMDGTNDLTIGPTIAAPNGESTAMGDGSEKTITIGKDYFILRNNGPLITLFNRVGTGWVVDDSFKRVSLGYDTQNKNLYAGNNFFVVTCFMDAGQQNSKSWLYLWNGLSWVNKWAAEDFNDLHNKEIDLDPYSNSFVMRYGTDAQKLRFFYKFQDDCGTPSESTPIYTYSVTSKTTDPVVAGTTQINTYFNYNESIGNYSNGTTKYNRVDVSQQNIGTASSFYFNNTLANSQSDSLNGGNSIYDKLDGYVYKTVTKNANNKTIANTSTTYNVYRDTINWPDDIYQKRVTKTKSMLNNVTSVNDVLAYDNTNGLPYLSRTANSDGKQKLSKTFFAFENPQYSSAMGVNGANMLSQPCQTIIYEKAAGDNTAPDSSDVRSSQATTYSNVLGCNAWLPFQSYVWKVPMNNSGIPQVTYTDFIFTTPSLSTNWKLAGGITRYSPFGNALESVNPLGVYSTKVYGTSQNLPIGSISPANFYESGVFTCDYDLSELYGIVMYLDSIGGWEKSNNWASGGNAISNSQTHFGQKSLYLNNGESGIIRVAKVTGGASYTFSAWARVNSGTLNMKAEYYTGSPTVTSWPVDKATLTSAGIEAGLASMSSTGGNWQLLKTAFIVPPAVNNYYVIAYLGGSGSYDAHIDDIRFGPSKAQISTTYYDTLWQQPVLSVGPDNNPGNLMEYDNFGRQSLTYKVNKNTNDLTVTSIKSYHLMNETPLFDPTKWYKIVTKLDTTKGVDIANGNVSIYEHQPLWLYQNFSHPNQLWKFIAAGDGNYYLQSKANTAYYVDDPYKTIVNGSQLQMWDGAGNNQKWNAVALQDGCFRITPFASGAKAMEYNAPAGEAPADTMHVQIGAYKGRDNQKWRIVAVP